MLGARAQLYFVSREGRLVLSCLTDPWCVGVFVPHHNKTPEIKHRALTSFEYLGQHIRTVEHLAPSTSRPKCCVSAQLDIRFYSRAFGVRVRVFVTAVKHERTNTKHQRDSNTVANTLRAPGPFTAPTCHQHVSSALWSLSS